jgi:hypothetical protein
MRYSNTVCIALYDILANTTDVRYFGDHNIDGMFATLAPLHDLVDKVSLLRVRLLYALLTLYRVLRPFERSRSFRPSDVNSMMHVHGATLIVALVRLAI